MTGVLAVDPPGCGCTECATGVYVPLDQATPSQVAAAARGVLGNNTGFGRAELAARSLPRETDIDCLTDEYLAQVLAVPRTRDGNPVPDFRLRCPFCGGELSVSMATMGGTYLSYEVADCLECEDCGAEWEPNGDLRRAPSAGSLAYAEHARAERPQ